MEQRDFMTRAKQLVVDYFNSHVDATDGKKLTMEDVFIEIGRASCRERV